MKRLINYFLALAMAISLCGCAGNVSHELETSPTPTPAATAGQTKHSGFEIHYIDVGQGDSALVLCDDEAMLIDGGKSKASDVIYTYLKKQNVERLDYIVCSHADEDHIGGLSAPLSTIDVGGILAPKTGADTNSYRNIVRKAEERGIEIDNPKPGDEMKLGSSTVEFFGPITESESDRNNGSIVMKIVYGDTSFLFTGDAEREEEQEILNAGYDLSADVLKVGHHGSKNSTTYPFLREIMPKYAVISVGKGNSYGHPTEDTLSRLRDADVTVYRTDIQGDIIAKSDGKNVTITTSKNENAQTNPTEQAKREQHSAEEKSNTPKPSAGSTAVGTAEETDGAYIGNKNTKKFHLPNCGSLPIKENRVYFDTREAAEESGYNPCGRCKP